MKRILSLVLIISLLAITLSGCNISQNNTASKLPLSKTSDEVDNTLPTGGVIVDENGCPNIDQIEEIVYEDLLNKIEESGRNDIFIENVEAEYYSEEYIEELNSNSRQNEYFGANLDVLDQAFQGEKYVFTVNDDGETVVKPFEPYDDTYEKIVTDVAIGAGVILVLVAVSTATAGTSVAIVSVSASVAASVCISSAVIGAIIEGTTIGIETKDTKKALEAAAAGAANGFKWGAITLVIPFAAIKNVKYAKNLAKLRGIKLNGLSIKQAVYIQRNSKYPLDIIKKISSMKEFKVFTKARLKPRKINGKNALVQKVSKRYKSPNDEFGRTNLQRMKEGLAPYDKTGKKYEVHHIGQAADARYAILKQSQHKAIPTKHGSKVEHGSEWAKERSDFWKAYAETI